MPTRHLRPFALHFSSALCLSASLVSFTARAADCTVNDLADLTQTNGNACLPDSFKEGDDLILQDGTTLTVTDLHGLRIGVPDGSGGIDVGVDNARILINGTIEAINSVANSSYWDAPRGVSYFGNGGFVQNNGRITVRTPSDDPLDFDDDKNNGNGREPKYGMAIHYFGDHGSVENNGLIETRMNRGFGIRYDGDHGRVVNNNRIEVEGFFARGIQLGPSKVDITDDERVNNTTIINNGIISMGDFENDPRDNDNIGIYVNNGSDNAIINTGTIQTRDHGSHGIMDFSQRARLSNYGTIKTSGDYAAAAKYHAPGSTLINFGTIETHGYLAAGLLVQEYEWAYDDDIVELQLPSGYSLVNYGNIETFGDASYGIAIYPNVRDSQVINSGTIKVHGNDVYGIVVSGRGTQKVLNAGYVGVQKDAVDAYSIYLNWDEEDETSFDLTLLSGSALVGFVGFEFPELTKVHFGKGVSGAVHIDPDSIDGDSDADGASDLGPYITLTSPTGVHVAKGFGLYVADLSDLAAQDGLMFDIARSVTQAITAPTFYEGGSGGDGGGDGGGGGDESSGGEIGLGCRPWITPFGGYLSNDNDPDFGFDGGYGGFAIGCRLDPGVGLFAGATYGQVESRDNDLYASESYSGFAGVYGEIPHFTSDFAYRLTLGYMHHETDREIVDNLEWHDGKETLSDSYGTFFVTPSLTANRLFGTALDLMLSYTGVLHGEQDYLSTQSDAEADQAFHLTTDERYSQSVDLRIAFTLDISETSAIKIGGGASYQTADDAAVKLMDTSFELESPLDEVVGHAFVSLMAEETVWMTLGGTIGEDSYSLSASARYQF